MSENKNESNENRSQKKFRYLWYAGCATSTMSIVIASIGGHRYEWSPHKKYLFSIANTYGLTSGIGMLISSLHSKTLYPGALFMASVIGFCGPLWYKLFTDKNTFSKITPIGGTALILAWALLAIF
jgi:uncharacterized membrane protein YgdD (TMEM256/DUF423 family)